MSASNLTPGQAALLNALQMPEAGPAAQTAAAATTPNVTVGQLSDSEISNLLSLLLQEQQERAIQNADPDALTEDGFARMFDRNGHAAAPELINGILVCAGSLIARSATAHECSFVHVDESWCWEHPDSLNDEVRKLPLNGRENQRSITLIPVEEGSKIDFVTCKRTERDGHKATKSTSYVVSEGRLEVTNTRSAPKPSFGK